MDKKLNKEALHVRVTRYETGRARKNAERLDMKISEYFNMILHDANDHYDKVEVLWKSYLRS